MKKIIILLLIVALTFTLCSCAVINTNYFKNNNNQDTAANVINGNDTKDNNDAEVSTILAEEQAIEIANKLFDDLDKLDHLDACAIESDNEQSITVDGNLYVLVTDEEFTSMQDLENFTKNTITANVSDYSALYNNSNTAYVESDGKLYVALAGRGCGFSYTGEATVSDITETAFTSERHYDNFGEVATLEIKVVLEDNIWKVDKINFK